MSALRMVRIVLWLSVALAAGATGALFYMSSQPSSAAGPHGSPFHLVDQDGAAVTREALAGQPSAVFFGFTHCPDVCPTTLFELSGHQEAVREKGGDFRIVFVTVDPERDTPDVLKSYVGSVAPDAMALTGEPEAVSRMLEGWGVHAAKVGEGPDYTMDHTATTLLLDAAGALSGTIAYGENPDTARAKIERLAGV